MQSNMRQGKIKAARGGAEVSAYLWGNEGRLKVAIVVNIPLVRVVQRHARMAPRLRREPAPLTRATAPFSASVYR